MELTRKKRFNNERVQPSQIKFHLCFYCGEQFSSLTEYQRHVIHKHQAIALCYQIYQAEFRTERRQRKNESDQAQQALKSKEGPPTSPSTSSTRKHIPGEAFSELARVSVKSNRLSGEYERGRDDKQRRERESFGFGREKEIERVERERRYRMERDKKQKEDRRRKMEVSGRISPSILSRKKLQKKSKATDFDLPHHDTSCSICEPDLVFSDPSFTIQHIVRSHGASIVSMVVLLYDNDVLLATKPSKSGENCPRCDIDFDFPTEYFLHLIMAHRLDVGTSFKKNKYPTCTNFAIKTSLQCKQDSLLVITSRDRLPDDV